MFGLIKSNLSHPNEYYLAQYDTTPARKLDLKEGDWVKFSRYVVRVGYKIEPKIYSREEWNECGFQIIKEETGIEEDKLRNLFNELNLFSPYKGIREKIYRRLVIETRYLKIQQESSSDRSEVISKYYNRHIWLADVGKEIMGQVSGTNRYQTGVYNPAYKDDEDYEPAFLSPVYHHTLYKINCGLEEYLVHPNDLKV